MSIIRGKKILVVDGDIGPRESIRMILETYGAIVRTADDGNEALKLLEANSFDLITTSLRVDGMNGIELCKEIHARRITTPVVVITLYRWFKEGDIEGVVDCIVKPFDLEDVRSRIEKVLEYSPKPNQGLH